jgi:hypothetical protein
MEMALSSVTYQTLIPTTQSKLFYYSESLQ